MTRQHRNNLFTACNLSIILQNNCSSVIHQVESIPDSELIAAGPDIVIEKILKENSINPIILHKKNIKIHKPVRCKINSQGKPFPLSFTEKTNLVDGVDVLIEIPYSGDKRLWLCQPSMHYIRGGPSFTIKNDRIIKNYTQPVGYPAERIMQRFTANYKKIRKYLQWQAEEIRLYEAKLRNITAKAIHYREFKIELKHPKIETAHSPPQVSTQQAEPLGSPLEIKKKMLPQTPPVSEREFTRHPFISGQDFDSILEIIRNTGRIFEKAPGIFNIHTAEELRNILISNLNTHFAGKTNEELFNHRGKTHFDIKVNNREVLLGKCAIWNCPEGAIYTINNLLSDSGWQECKIPFIIFNINFSNFMDILFQAENALLDHPCLINLNEAVRENEWSLNMRGLKNTAMRFNLQIMVYNLYKEKKKENPLLTKSERNFFAKIA